MTLFGIVTLVRFMQLKKAKFPIDVTPGSITIVLIDEQLACHGTSTLRLQSSIAPVPVIVKVPLSSRLHVRFVPHEPLLAANTVVGKSKSTIQRVSRILKIRFFIIFPPKRYF